MEAPRDASAPVDTRVHTRVHTHGVGGGRGSRRSAPCQAPGPPAALSGSGQRECKGLSFQNTSFNTAKGTRMPRAAASEGSWGGWGGSTGGGGGWRQPQPPAGRGGKPLLHRLRWLSRRSGSGCEAAPPWAAPERPGRPPARSEAVRGGATGDPAAARSGTHRPGVRAGCGMLGLLPGGGGCGKPWGQLRPGAGRARDRLGKGGPLCLCISTVLENT